MSDTITTYTDKSGRLVRVTTSPTGICWEDVASMAIISRDLSRRVQEEFDKTSSGKFFKSLRLKR